MVFILTLWLQSRQAVPYKVILLLLPQAVPYSAWAAYKFIVLTAKTLATHRIASIKSEIFNSVISSTITNQPLWQPVLSFVERLPHSYGFSRDSESVFNTEVSIWECTYECVRVLNKLSRVPLSGGCVSEAGQLPWIYPCRHLAVNICASYLLSQEFLASYKQNRLVFPLSRHAESTRLYGFLLAIKHTRFNISSFISACSKMLMAVQCKSARHSWIRKLQAQNPSLLSPLPLPAANHSKRKSLPLNLEESLDQKY